MAHDKQSEKKRLDMMLRARAVADVHAAMTQPIGPPPVQPGDHVECPACYGFGAVYSHTTGKVLVCSCCRGHRNVKVEAAS